MATKNPIGNYMNGERELPFEELFLAKKPFYKRAAKYIAPPLIGMTMLAGCATDRYYERVEAMPDEVDVLNIDSRPQGAEVIYDGRVIGKTPMQVTVTFKRQKRMEIEGTEKGGRIVGEKVGNTFTSEKPGSHTIKLFAPGYLEKTIEHYSDGVSGDYNGVIVLKKEYPPQPYMHQEQNVIIKQEGKFDKSESKQN